jgi:hypothetical protein
MTQRHPALVLFVDSSVKPAEVIVAGGTSHRKGNIQRPQQAYDFLVKESDDWFDQTGLTNPTCFHLDEPNVLRLAFDQSIFVAVSELGPKIGALPLTRPEVLERLRLAGQAGNLYENLKKLGVTK